MYSIKLEWKEFNVCLEDLEAHLRAEYPNYVGNQAANALDLYFSEEPSEEDRQAIQDHWDEIDGSNYLSAEDFKQIVADTKLGLLSKSWDEMTAVERKIALNMEVTREEMGL